MKTITKIIIFIFLLLITNFQKIYAEEKIRIGLLVPLSGEHSEIGNSILKSVRLAINKIDNQLLEIIKKRVKFVDLVIKNKKFKKDIIDKKRISIILKNISKKSKNKKIDPKITNRIWKSMIKAFIEYEFRNFYKK